VQRRAAFKSDHFQNTKTIGNLENVHMTIIIFAGVKVEPNIDVIMLRRWYQDSPGATASPACLSGPQQRWNF
jgi:hypothetical protein